jgi:hypothetical protein
MWFSSSHAGSMTVTTPIRPIMPPWKPLPFPARRFPMPWSGTSSGRTTWRRWWPPARTVVRRSFPLFAHPAAPGTDLVAELEGPVLRQAIARKFALDLTDAPTMLTLRGRTR